MCVLPPGSSDVLVHHFLVSLIHILLRQLTFCTDTEIPHFFCERAQIIKVACSDTLINNICLYVVTALLGVFPLTGILLLPNHFLFNENVLCSRKT